MEGVYGEGFHSIRKIYKTLNRRYFFLTVFAVTYFKKYVIPNNPDSNYAQIDRQDQSMEKFHRHYSHAEFCRRWVFRQRHNGHLMFTVYGKMRLPRLTFGLPWLLRSNNGVKKVANTAVIGNLPLETLNQRKEN